jgi:ketosteroid isomerase-like protein
LPENLNKRRILDYLKAGYAGDIKRAANYYDDEIDFIGYAPIDVFPTLGQRFGKPAMVDSLVRMHALYRLIEYDVTTIVAEDNRVAAMLDLRMYVRGSDRIVRLPFGNFYTLRQGRIFIFRQFLDSFDAVQQKLRVDLVEAMKEKA